jgi:Flp pilus assembly protein TadG
LTHEPPRRLHLRHERGQSLVELVVGLPMLALILVAILQFGIVMHDYVEVTDAARAAARKASVSRKSDPRAAAEDAARESAKGLDGGRLGVEVTPDGVGRRGDPVAVEVSYPYEVDLLGIVFQRGTMTFRATARMQ